MAVLQLVDGGAGRAHEGLPPTLDLLVEGTNLTARIAEVDLAPLLCELGAQLCLLALRKVPRATVRCYGADGPWELGLERAGDRVLVSLFRGGPEPEVAVLERDVELAALMNAALGAMERLEVDLARAPLGVDLGRARAELAHTRIVNAPPPPSRSLVQIEPEGESAVRISAELAFRAAGPEPHSVPDVERADLFGLLVRGTLRVAVGDRVRSFPDRLAFLFAERLLALAAETLGSWEKGQSYHRRVDLAGVVLGVRFGSDGAAGEDSGGQRDGRRPDEGQAELWLTVSERASAKASETRTFLLPDARAFVQGCVYFGRALARAFLRHDPAQRQNLRLSAFRKAVRVLDERLREAERDDAKVNPSPEPYRAFAVPLPSPAPVGRETAKLGFTPAWTASMAAIDLRATFLCGDHLIVGALHEAACLDRRTGRFVWRRPMQQAVSVVTTLGLARLFADGSVSLHDFGTGDVLLTAKVAPRAGGLITGAVVSSPGLPRLLVLSEGKRHLSALDLSSGEVRWRHAAHGGSLFRLRRAGRLLIVVAGDAALTALDLLSGEVVWRARDRLRFGSHVGLDHESLFAVAGEPDPTLRGPLRLYHFDPYAGLVRWVRDLPPGTRPLGAPIVTDREVVLVVSDCRGLGLMGLDRASGRASWSVRPGLCPVTSAWLAVDDAVIINSEAGDLFSVATESGAIRWRQRFASGMEGDQPRRLEPILRSGALFVPQQQVHVVRLRDGALLGRVATELIPDLLRVDERCDVYLAEESGHLAAFRAGAKLSVVE